MKDFLDKAAGRAARWAVLGACAVAAVAAPQVATAAISGTAFMDYNSNGVKSTGAFTAGTGVGRKSRTDRRAKGSSRCTSLPA